MRKFFLITTVDTVLAGLSSAALFLLQPPELGRLSELSNYTSESGEVINLRLTPSGHWRAGKYKSCGSTASKDVGSL